MNIRQFFHHLFNPHCSECKEEQEENNHCKSCETLRIQLDRSQQHVQQLLSSIIQQRAPEVTTEYIPTETQIKARHVPWSVKRQMLEQESRKQAQLMKEKISEIEKEVGLQEGGEDAS